MVDEMPEDDIPAERKFTVRQQRFIDEFCTGKNCTQAAIAAGYSAESAYNQGSRLMKNDEIKAAVDERLNAYSITATMATKLNAEIATTRLNDFFTIQPVQGYELGEQYLSVLTERKREEVEFIEDFAGKNGIPLLSISGPTEMAKRLALAQQQLLELELELRAHGPDAVKLVPGRPVTHYRADLDIVKLAEAKEGGRLKSYSVGKDGIKVEMYAADAAIDRAARMHGLYEKDNRQAAGTDVEITIGGSPDEAQA